MARTKTEIHVVPAFHYDVAYCKTFKEYLEPSIENISSALKLLRQHADYTYCIEQVILLREYWQRKPQDRGKLRRYAAEGRLVFAPGMFTMPDSNIPSGESFIRNALIGRRWLREHLGITPTCCWMADVFGHNPQSPQLALTCGFDSYMFERGKAGGWDTTFLWQGIDGTVIPAHWEVDTYYGINLALAWCGARPRAWIENRLWQEVIRPLTKNSPTGKILLSALSGDFLKPSAAHIAFVRAWNRRNPDVRLRFSTPDKYFTVLERHRSKLKTASDDLNPLFQGCNSSRIRIKQYNRRLEELAASLELVECMSGRRSHAASEALWEVIAWNAFHDILCGSLEKKAAREALRKYHRAERRALKALETGLSALAAPMYDDGKAPGSVVFNSLPYPRGEIIAVPHEDNQGGATKVGFTEVQIGACGFSPVGRPVRKTRNLIGGVKVGERGRLLENDKVRLLFGANGTIVSLYDKGLRCDLALSDNGMNNLMRQPDYGDPWMIGSGPVNGSLLRTAPFHDPQAMSGTVVMREGSLQIRAADADCMAWSEPVIIHNHPLQGTVELDYSLDGLATQVTLRRGERLIRFRTTFVPKGKKYRLRVAFPTTILDGRIRHSVPCGHIRRPQGEYAAQGWIDYADTGKGLLLLNRGLPGNNVTGGVMMLSLFRGVSLEAAEERPWYEDGIEHVFEYALMPFDPRDKAYNPARLAAIYNRPLHAFALAPDSRRTRLPERPAFVEIEGDNAELSCVRRENGSLVLRLWESRGRQGSVICILDREIISCERTDATGENPRSQQFVNNRIRVELNAFEIMTLKVALNPAENS